MQRHSHIRPIEHAGHACLELSTRHGNAIIALHGAQLLSWVPLGGHDVFWLSPTARAEPAAIRGGVPICWPWFGKQGMPDGAMQHGPARIRRWQLDGIQADDAERISLRCVPCPPSTPDDPLALFAPHLQVSLEVELGTTLALTLQTRNLGNQAFTLTQALHNYFAVHDATQVQVSGLAGLHYKDQLQSGTERAQHGPFALDQACDRVYHHGDAAPTHRYTLEDRLARRRIHVATRGSQSLVVWNPGSEQSATMADLPPHAWRHFLCLEAANAGADVVVLQPGGQHRLTQTIAWEPWDASSH